MHLGSEVFLFYFVIQASNIIGDDLYVNHYDYPTNTINSIRQLLVIIQISKLTSEIKLK